MNKMLSIIACSLMLSTIINCSDAQTNSSAWKVEATFHNPGPLVSKRPNYSSSTVITYETSKQPEHQPLNKRVRNITDPEILAIGGRSREREEPNDIQDHFRSTALAYVERNGTKNLPNVSRRPGL